LYPPADFFDRIHTRVHPGPWTLNPGP
jgi:hypothetical protein